MERQNGYPATVAIRKSTSCKLGTGIAFVVGVTNKMSAQGTVVAPLKNSSSFYPTPTL
jgi:hypothetical protein